MEEKERKEGTEEGGRTEKYRRNKEIFGEKLKIKR
jgi:hypothetical protein